MKLSRRGFLGSLAIGVIAVPILKKTARADKGAAPKTAEPKKQKKKVIWIGHSA